MSMRASSRQVVHCFSVTIPGVSSVGPLGFDQAHSQIHCPRKMESSSPFAPKKLLTAFESLYTRIFMPPNLKLKVKSVPRPNFYFVIAVLAIASYMIFSGLFYDIINTPQSIGSERDPRTGYSYPVVVARGGMSSQYVIEGFSAGFFFLLGGVGIVCFLKGTPLMTLVGSGVVLFAYLILSMFMKAKMGGYPF